MLDLWQRRQILAKSVLKPALDLLGKMKAEHEAAAAAAAMAANKMGQPMMPRRPLRLVMPYAPLDSETGLPTHTICYPLDQWGSLAGFRYLTFMCACCPCYVSSLLAKQFSRVIHGRQSCYTCTPMLCCCSAVSCNILTCGGEAGKQCCKTLHLLILGATAWSTARALDCYCLLPACSHGVHMQQVRFVAHANVEQD